MPPITIADYDALARERIAPAAWDYYSGGAGAADGAAGVEHALGLLGAELELAMALCGTPRIADISPALVARDV